jgi:hypothetical protein
MKIPICYQCGEEMFDEEYYLANIHLFVKKPKMKHCEHIIQNALYGKLKPNNILCKDCGSNFSQEIDKNFVSLFNCITEQIREILIRKDHSNENLNTLKGILYEDENLQQKKDVLIRENEVSPVEPFYEFDEQNRTIKIFANKKRAKQYKPIIINELTGKGIKTDDLNYEVISDISGKGILGIFFSEGVENFNDKFKIGFCKIAVGYASYCGIKRDEMPNTLVIEENNLGHIVYKNSIIPFVPIGSVDSMFEVNRPEIEDNYPSHTLILFTQKIFDTKKKHLYCYIDLFSTFQFYVLLNDNYYGSDIYQPYYQATTKPELPDIDVRRIRPKHLNIIIDMYGIDRNKYQGKTLDDFIDFVDKAVKNYTFNPKLNFKTELKKIYSILLTNFMISKSNSILQDNLVIQNLRTMHESHKLAFMLELREFFIDENNFNFNFYRKNFIEDDSENSFETLSSPIECTHILTTDELRKQYGHLKFGQISKFIDVVKKENT